MAIKYKLHPNFKVFENELFNIKEVFLHDNKIIHNARNVLKVIPLHGIDTVVKAFRVPNAINQFAYAYIRKSIGHKKINKITYADLLKIQNGMTNVANSTKNTLKMILRPIFTEQIKLGNIHENHIDKLETYNMCRYASHLATPRITT